MDVVVFVPQQLQRYPLTAQLLVNLFPVGQGSGRGANRRLGGAAQQLLDQFVLRQVLRQRPVQTDSPQLV